MVLAERDVQSFQNLRAHTVTNKVDASNQPETADRNAGRNVDSNAAQEAVDSGIPTKCNAVANLDLDGPAVAWGMSFRKVKCTD